jgi:hypothetical protein
MTTKYGAFETKRLLDESARISHENETLGMLSYMFHCDKSFIGGNILHNLTHQQEQLHGAYRDVNDYFPLPYPLIYFHLRCS